MNKSKMLSEEVIASFSKDMDTLVSKYKPLISANDFATCLSASLVLLVLEGGPSFEDGVKLIHILINESIQTHKERI